MQFVVKIHRVAYGPFSAEELENFLADESNIHAEILPLQPKTVNALNEALRETTFIGAIKSYRQYTGCTLLEAKNALDPHKEKFRVTSRPDSGLIGDV